MSVNSGLTSRFLEVIDFRALTAEECMALMTQQLRKEKHALKAKSGKELDLSCLEEPTAPFRDAMLRILTELAAQDNWASARDVQVLANGAFNTVLRDKEGIVKGHLVLTEEAITTELESMLNERASRANTVKLAGSAGLREMWQQQFAPHNHGLSPRPAPFSTAASTSSQAKAPAPPSNVGVPPKDAQEPTSETVVETKPVDGRHSCNAVRDAGVSDAVWEQLQRDRQAEEEREEQFRELQKAAREARDAARDKTVKRLLEEEARKKREEEATDAARLEEEARRKREEEAANAARDKIMKRLLEEKARRKREEEARKKLKEWGVCPMGYNWIRQTGGWRCAGGSHWMAEGDLGL